MKTLRLLAITGVVTFSPAVAQDIRVLPGTPTPRRPASECVGVMAPDSGTADFRRANNRVMVLPPTDFPPALKGQTFAVRSRVDINGDVDSVVILGGAVDGKFLAKWMRTIRGAKYLPAVYQGCPVVDWTEVKVTFHRAATTTRRDLRNASGKWP